MQTVMLDFISRSTQLTHTPPEVSSEGVCFRESWLYNLYNPRPLQSMLEYQLHTVRNGHQLTPTLTRGEGDIM